MNHSSTLLIFWVGQYLVQLPALLVALVACIVVLTKRRRAPQGSTWALWGFGLALVLGIAIPIVQTMVQRWMLQTDEPLAHQGYVLTGLSFFWNVLHAVAYALLLVAVLAGRSLPPSASPPPLPRRADAGPV